MPAEAITEDYRILALREMERRLRRMDRVEEAMRSVDNIDWDYLLNEKLGYGGRDRFWREALTNLRTALSGDQQ